MTEELYYLVPKEDLEGLVDELLEYMQLPDDVQAEKNIEHPLINLSDEAIEIKARESHLSPKKGYSDAKYLAYSQALKDLKKQIK
jgi:hypothetical protein